MTNQHPITPPPELVEQWHDAWIDAKVKHDGFIDFLAAQAAQWGADQELKACLDEIYKGVGLRIIDHGSHRELLCSDLRAARRPKPPSLKEQALAILNDCSDRLDGAHENIIRRALEALDD